MHYALEFLRLQQQQRRQQDVAQLEHWLLALTLGATSQALEAAARLPADKAAAAASEAARVAILACILLDRRQVLFDMVGAWAAGQWQSQCGRGLGRAAVFSQGPGSRSGRSCAAGVQGPALPPSRRPPCPPS
jgi:hypothetical protein